MALTEQLLSINSSPLAPIDIALRQIFPNNEEESRLLSVRRIMGVSVNTLSDEELEIYVTQLQHLIDYWLDNFERQMFNGQTLSQTLGT